MAGTSSSSGAFPCRVAISALLLVFASTASADDSESSSVKALFARHCLACHGSDKTEGDLRIDELSSDFTADDSRERWQQVLRRVLSGEMPPEDAPQPTAEERHALTAWIGRQLAAEAARRRTSEGRVFLRRLNRIEYENTLRDLLGIRIEVQDMLPEDTPADGFDNVGAALHSSSFLLERYLEAASAALDRAIASEPQPPLVHERYRIHDERQVKIDTERVYLHTENALVFFSSSDWNSIVLSQFYPPHGGTYRLRLRVQAFQNGEKPVVFRIDAGPMLMGTKQQLIGYFDAPAAAPREIEFTIPLEARSTIRIAPYGLARAQTVSAIGAETYTGPGLAVEWVDLEGPLHDVWPPESHRRLFGDLAQSPAADDPYRLEVVSAAPDTDAARIVGDFARRAFRRSVSDAEVQPYLDLIHAKQEQGESFARAVRAGLLAVLMSPKFLFLRETPGPLDDYALASRLSYFLWSTLPDEELLALAEAGRLRESEVLHAQVERLLNAPQAAAFTRNFVGQWLNLRDIDFTEPSHILYPEYDLLLKESMLRETELFFTELLAHDLSWRNFLASDFTLLNGRLARHYGIPGVEGWEFQRVQLPPGSHRGGLLTMASVLKVTANGTNTSPVLRGAWVLDRILGEPPPGPPANVPALEPDIRGATTIREQLARHRADAACASCHAQIDPLGFALESFDVIGGWRDYYRSSGNGQEVVVDGQRMPYLHGLAVDPADALSDGRTFSDIDELKQLLLVQADVFARALTTKLLTYATGGAPEAVDAEEVDRILARTNAANDGFRTLIHEIVDSRLFREK